MFYHTQNRNARLLARAALIAASPFLLLGTAGAQSSTMTQPDSNRATTGRDSTQAIVDLLVVANKGEVEAGKLAVSKATRADVKAYAQKMVDEHSAALRTLADSASAGGWARPDSSDANAKGMKGMGGQYSINAMKPDSLSQRQAGSNAAMTVHAANTAAVEKLKGTDKGEFDRMYLASQVEGHEMLLKTLDQHTTSNARLQSMVMTMKATVRDHLAAVRQLQTASASLK